MANGWKVAASVILVSRSSGRILMMRRGSGAKFMPNALVFPGGVIAPTDEALGTAVRVAALREVFEETGLLISKSGLELASSDSKLADEQEKLKNDASIFKQICPSPPTDSLIEWNTWLTPTNRPMRFMTSFFLLLVDGEPEIRMCEKEMAGYSWIDAKQCLDSAFSGEVAMPPPQTYELTRMAQISIDRLPSSGNVKRVICPQPIVWNDGSKWSSNILPGDHLYLEENAFMQPGRTMKASDVAVDPNMPTHRIEFGPNWIKSRVYQHMLKEPYLSDFQPFVSQSKML